MTRGRWAAIGVFAVYGTLGVGAFLWLGWTWVGVITFVAICVAGSLLADWVFHRLASEAEKKVVMEERLQDLG